MKRLLLTFLPLALTHCLGPGEGREQHLDTAPEATTQPDATLLPDASSSDAVIVGDAGLSIVAAEGVTVAPQTALHFRVATEDIVPASVVWSVDQPAGSAIRMVTDPATGEMTFEANVVGGYRITAVAYFPNGDVITTLTLLVSVVPAHGLHIELTWRTPGDIDETDVSDGFAFDSAGSDVDLHLLHPQAYGAFFHQRFDCFWQNKIPVWGAPGPIYSPELDRDDTDGAGPEIIALTTVEPDASYVVGVHYYSDWSYGNAWATVRIYLHGVLLEEWAEVELRSDDLWQSHTITNGIVTRIGSTPVITPHYSDTMPGHSPGNLTLDSKQGTTVKPATAVEIEGTWHPVDAVLDHLTWSVTQPDGSLAPVAPGSSLFAMTFVPQQLGFYTITGLAINAAGDPIGSATLVVFVTGSPNLRVELTWRTPGDPDETDTGGIKGGPAVGTDLDLHLLHPRASDYFDVIYDCNWHVPNREWGVEGPTDNPTLDRDDFDGAGPEAITLPAPEPGRYRVGVLFPSDSGFGNAFATLRVYVDDVLIDEWADVELTQGDLWDAFQIVAGGVGRIGTVPTIRTIEANP